MIYALLWAGLMGAEGKWHPYRSGFCRKQISIKLKLCEYACKWLHLSVALRARPTVGAQASEKLRLQLETMGNVMYLTLTIDKYHF